MKSFKEFTEEYNSLATSPVNKGKFPIYENPSKSEMKEVANKDGMVRFISHDKKLYAFHPELLHAHAIKHLGLNIPTSQPSATKAYLGIAKLDNEGNASLHHSSQILDVNPEDLEKHHPHLRKFIRPRESTGRYL